jgi:hypothetical protein
MADEQQNKLYLAESLDILRKYTPHGSVGLAYLDPAINSNSLIELNKLMSFWFDPSSLHMNTLPNDYYLAYHIQLSPEVIKSNLFRQISSPEMLQIQNALTQIGDFNDLCNLYDICDKNYQSILSFYGQLETNYISNRSRAREFIEDTAQEMNRLLLNYLSTFKTFRDHLKTRYTHLERQGYSYLDDFNKITSICYDTNFSYRFFSKLRDYVQHCGLPVHYIDIYDTLQGGVQISIAFSRDQLISLFKKWGPTVKNDLLQQPEHFEILPLLKQFRGLIQLINTVLTSMELFIVHDSYNRLCELVNEVISQYPNGQPFIALLAQREHHETRLLCNYFPLRQMRKFRDKHSEIHV